MILLTWVFFLFFLVATGIAIHTSREFWLVRDWLGVGLSVLMGLVATAGWLLINAGYMVW